MRLNNKLLSRKCAILETVIDQLKNMSQIVRKACRRQTLKANTEGKHFRHRSPVNCFCNIICGLMPTIPSLKSPLSIQSGFFPDPLNPN
jgi:hypothetical protein